MAKSRFPNAIDIIDAIDFKPVADAAGTTPEVARKIMEAHFFGIIAVTTSGSTVLLKHGLVFGPTDSAVRKYINQNREHLLSSADELLARVVAREMPTISSAPRYDPVREWELAPLTEILARCCFNDLDSETVDRVIDAWWDAVDGIVENPPDIQVVLRRRWDVLEKDFETWLVENLDDVSGKTLSLKKRQHKLPSGGIIDVLCSVTDAGDEGAMREGELAVIENKVGEATVKAVEQLDRYIEELENGTDIDVLVWGELLATGIGESADARARELGFRTSTWAELGYFDHLWFSGSTDKPLAFYLQNFNEGSPWERAPDEQ